MAEVLSIVAASLQLSELLLKLGTRGGKLIIRFKNAPNEVRRKVQTIKDFQTFCVSCQLLLGKHATVLDNLIEQDAIAHIKALLKRSESTLDHLEQAITELELHPNDSRYVTLRKGAKTIKQKDRFDTQIKTLNDVREQLDSYFVRQIWSLLVNQTSTSTEASITDIQASQSLVKADLSLILQHQGTLENSLSPIEATISSIHGAQQSLSTQVTDLHDNLGTQFASTHQSTETIQSMMRHNTISLKEHIDRKLTEMNDSFKDMSFSGSSNGQRYSAANLEFIIQAADGMMRTTKESVRRNFLSGSLKDTKPTEQLRGCGS
ncbi:hypothetical protein N0V90_009576 [Kalmusia sp. IMI 367209]|nr:hypothetical protein N0V90_009576 [Kalmusia sp. IMI 367209]